MTPQLQRSDTSLTISRTFDAPLARLWQFWTNPAELTKWHAPGDAEATIHRYEAQQEGRLDIEMKTEGKVLHVRGTFLVVDALDKLVHTWQAQEPDDGEDTKVTVTFRDTGHGMTEVVLTHGGLADEDAVEEHADGWASMFDKLARVV